MSVENLHPLSGKRGSQSAVPGASTPRVRRRSEAVNIDHGQLVGRHLNRFAIVMDLHELAPVDRRATGGRAGRRLERLAEVFEGLTSRGRAGTPVRRRTLLRQQPARRRLRLLMAAVLAIASAKSLL